MSINCLQRHDVIVLIFLGVMLRADFFILVFVLRAREQAKIYCSPATSCVGKRVGSHLSKTTFELLFFNNLFKNLNNVLKDCLNSVTFSIINFIRGDLKKRDLCVDKSLTTWRSFTFVTRIGYFSPFFTVSKRPKLVEL